MSEELDPSTRDFIADALREERLPNLRQLARIRSRVVASALAVSSAAGGVQAAGLAGKASVLAFSTPLVKSLLVGSLVVGGAATLAVTLPDRGPARAPAATAVIAGSAHAERALHTEPAAAVTPRAEPLLQEPEPPVTNEPIPAPPAAEPRNAPSPSSTAATVEPTPLLPRRPSLSEELAVLQAAQARLNAGDGKGALRLLDETAVAHGAGQLSVERRAVEILAACKAGELQRADRLGREFLAAHPDVPAAARVRASCAGEGR